MLSPPITIDWINPHEIGMDALLPLCMVEEELGEVDDVEWQRFELILIINYLGMWPYKVRKWGFPQNLSISNFSLPRRIYIFF